MSNEDAISLADLTPFNTAPTYQAFPFMRLPPELRLAILECNLLSALTISWQGTYKTSKNQSKTSQDSTKPLCNGSTNYLPLRYNIASPLLVSRAFYLAAAPIFYARNTFRFRSLIPNLPAAFNSATFTTNLRHLTIGIPARLSDRRRWVAQTDKTNSARISEIARLCPNLVEFVNHVPTIMEPWPLTGAWQPAGVRVWGCFVVPRGMSVWVFKCIGGFCMLVFAAAFIQWGVRTAIAGHS